MPADRPPFRVAFVSGVTVSKWSSVWAERRPDAPLRLVQTDATAQTSVLRSREADVSFVRLPIDDEGLGVIPLYWESAFVVVGRDHPIALFDEVTVADLADERVLTDAAEDAVALVAAGVGVTILPQSIARLHSRKDIVARRVTDAHQTRIALAWVEETADERTEEFIGIVRGRTARSSRGSVSTPPEVPKPARTPVRQPRSGGPRTSPGGRRRRGAR